VPTDPILPEIELRDLVRRRIEGGQLPLMHPEQINAGYGTRRVCAVCDQPIDAAKIEYEIRRDKLSALIFHFTCYVIWQRECSRMARKSSRLPEDEPPETGDAP
jgi:hypothetical protein